MIDGEIINAKALVILTVYNPLGMTVTITWDAHDIAKITDNLNETANKILLRLRKEQRKN